MKKISEEELKKHILKVHDLAMDRYLSGIDDSDEADTAMHVTLDYISGKVEIE